MSDDYLDIETTPKGQYALELIANGMPIEQAEAEADLRFSDSNTPREAVVVQFENTQKQPKNVEKGGSG